jgi:hypothetical protein
MMSRFSTRRGFSRPMAALAFLLQDRQDVLVERDLCRRRRDAGTTALSEEHEREQAGTHNQKCPHWSPRKTAYSADRRTVVPHVVIGRILTRMTTFDVVELISGRSRRRYERPVCSQNSIVSRINRLRSEVAGHSSLTSCNDGWSHARFPVRSAGSSSRFLPHSRRRGLGDPRAPATSRRAQAPTAPTLTRLDRFFWTALRRWRPRWLDAELSPQTFCALPRELSSSRRTARRSSRV